MFPFWTCLLEFLEIVVETRGSTVLIFLEVVQCHDVIGLRQVLRIDIVFTQLIDVPRVVVIVPGLDLAFNYHTRLELFSGGPRCVCSETCPHSDVRCSIL